MLENYYRQKIDAHREIRIRLCHKEQPQEGHLRAQGKHHETRRWPVLKKLRRGIEYHMHGSRQKVDQLISKLIFRSRNCIHVSNSRR